MRCSDKVLAKLIIEPKLVTGTSKAVYMENIQQDKSGGVYIDLTTTDASGAAPSVIVQGADPGYEISGSKLIYTNFAKGMYVVAVP